MKAGKRKYVTDNFLESVTRFNRFEIILNPRSNKINQDGERP